MKSFEEKLQQYTHKTRLKASERSDIRERILTYMEYHPLPKQSSHQEAEHMESERFRIVHFNTIYTRIAAGVFTLLLIIGVPLAAERSVPGDILYSFKTEVNEGIRSQFANSPYERVALETTLMERRIAEARLLKSEGKLTEEVEAAISETVEGHADAARESLAEIQDSSKEKAAIARITFGSALEVQSAVLSAKADLHASSTATSTLAGVIKEVRRDVAMHIASSTLSFEELMASVEQETTRAYELLRTVSESATEKQQEDIERRLEDIGRKIESAQKLQASGDSRAAQELAAALTLTQKLIVYMTDINVSTSVSLEELVPLELTDSERIAVVERLLERLREFEETIRARVPYIDDDGRAEKVSAGLNKLDSDMQTATSSLAENDIEQAETAVARAYDFATDLMVLTDLTEVPNTEDSKTGNATSTTATSTQQATSTATTTRATSAPLSSSE